MFPTFVLSIKYNKKKNENVDLIIAPKTLNYLAFQSFDFERT